MRLQPVTGIREPLKRRKDIMAQDVSHIRSFFEGIRDERGTHQNTATRIGTALLMLLEYLATIDYPYLRKDIDDAAAGHITFLKGITAQLQSLFADLAFTGVLKSEGGRGGFTDGKGIYMDAAEGLMEADGLNVRGFMRVMELVLNQLQVMHRDYSFTEGGVIERVEPLSNGTYRLYVRDEQDGRPVPFTEGDILYGIVNNLLERNVSSNGETPDCYKTWMRIEQDGVNQQDRTLTVRLYDGVDVPGGTNFTPSGLTVGSPQQESETEAYDALLAVTVHGNWLYDVVDGVKTARYADRQNSWLLSATDKRLSFLWGVDKPVVEDYNYALVLGILPDLANLPTTRDRSMPSLYVNTVFYDHHMEANYQVPPEYRVVDMGDWSQALAASVSMTATSRTDETGKIYVTPNTTRQVTGARNGLVVYDDGTAAFLTWQVTYMGMKWLCVQDGTTAAPSFGSAAWQPVGSRPNVSLGFFTDEAVPVPLLSLSVRPGHIDVTVVPYLLTDQEDTSADVTSWQWQRSSGLAELDAAWAAGSKGTQRRLHLTDDDFPTGWYIDGRSVSFTCTARIPDGQQDAVIMNKLTVI